jgi:hypothetical protein
MQAMPSTRNRPSTDGKAAAELRRAVRDAQYRAALGLPADEVLPAQLGTVGGSRGGHGGARINQVTTGQPAPWNVEARRNAARARWSLPDQE